MDLQAGDLQICSGKLLGVCVIFDVFAVLLGIHGSEGFMEWEKEILKVKDRIECLIVNSKTYPCDTKLIDYNGLCIE